MDRTKVRGALAGVGVTNITPFTPDGGELDIDGLRQNIHFLVTSGIPVIYPCGNTGEFGALSLEEWGRVVEVVIEAADSGCCILPGIGYSTSIAIELGLQAKSRGANGVLIMPPAQPYLSDEGLHAYYEEIIAAVGLPVVIYRRGPFPSDALLLELAQLPDVAGIKYALNDLSAFASLVDRTREEAVVWICGSAELWAPFFFLAGAQGFTSGIANLAPALSLELFSALSRGEYEEGMRLRRRIAPLEEVRARRGDAFNVPAVKAAMDQLGMCGGPVRPPLAAVDAAAREDIRRILVDWGAEAVRSET